MYTWKWGSEKSGTHLEPVAGMHRLHLKLPLLVLLLQLLELLLLLVLVLHVLQLQLLLVLVLLLLVLQQLLLLDDPLLQLEVLLVQEQALLVLGMQTRSRWGISANRGRLWQRGTGGRNPSRGLPLATSIHTDGAGGRGRWCW